MACRASEGEVAAVVDGWRGAQGGRRWEEDLDGVLRPDRWRDEPPEEPWGGSWGVPYERSVGRVSDVDLLTTRRDQVTTIVLIGDRVVDVVRTPARGSEYECVALELEDRRPPPPPPVPRPPGHELQLAWLATVVGGPEALGTLTDDPLPEEDLAVDEVPVHCRVRVGSVDSRMREPVLELMGVEALTAARRVLVRLARESPGAIGRTERDETAAAAVLWAVARGNDLAGQGRPLRATVVLQAFGLRSSPSTRALSYAHAVGGGPSGFAWNGYYGLQSPDVVPLGDPGFLLSSFRARLVAARDRALELRRRTEVA